jgi:hypothetical protein
LPTILDLKIEGTSDELLLGTCHWELGAAGLQDEMPT